MLNPLAVDVSSANLITDNVSRIVQKRIHMNIKLHATVIHILAPLVVIHHIHAAGVVVGWGAGTNNTGISPNFGQSLPPTGLTNVVAVAAGALHSVALKSDGTVVAWGYSRNGETNVPSVLSNVVAIAAGGFFGNNYGYSLALKSDGTVTGWGVISVPSSLSNVVAIAGGSSFWLALKNDGTVTGNCWDQANGLVTLDDGTLSNVVAITTGDYRCLALARDGTVIGWGRNYYGETTGVASGNLLDTNGTVTLGGQTLTNITEIAAGASHSLALTADGYVLAWGNDSLGQTNVPATLSNVVALAQGGSESTAHCLALKADGKIIAWGSNSCGQTNVPSGLSNIVMVAVGSVHSLALVGDGPPVTHALASNPTWNTNFFSVSLPTQNGHVYALEYENSLTDSNWNALPLAAGNGGILTLTDANAGDAQRFYRVRRW